MNPQIKTVLLTVLTLSVFTIAVIELSGISSTALWNKYNIDVLGKHAHKDYYTEEHMNREEVISGLPKTDISFEEEFFDFGTIEEGKKVRHTFVFTNTGENPLMISNAIPSCGCTVPVFSKAPIPPGEKGEITVEFDSANRQGHQRKNVIIVSNAKQEKISISFSVDVR